MSLILLLFEFIFFIHFGPKNMHILLSLVVILFDTINDFI